jgi:hypothetical protein
MIHYSVWFSFADGVDTDAELLKVRDCLEELLRQGKCASYRLLRKRQGLSNNQLPPLQAVLEFVDEEQFSAPFRDVRSAGVRNGLHGRMIENVSQMIVDTFEDISK